MDSTLLDAQTLRRLALVPVLDHLNFGLVLSPPTPILHHVASSGSAPTAYLLSLKDKSDPENVSNLKKIKVNPIEARDNFILFSKKYFQKRYKSYKVKQN